jgi:hypothetical protein
MDEAGAEAETGNPALAPTEQPDLFDVAILHGPLLDGATPSFRQFGDGHRTP